MRKELTEIAYILDRSSSMNGLRKAAVQAFNDFLNEQMETPGEANLSLVLFDDEYLMPIDCQPVEKIRPLTAEDYRPRATTALLDAIGMTIDQIGARLAKTPEAERPGQVIVAIFTDGFENSSRYYNMAQIKHKIRKQREKYNWEFPFLAGRQDANAKAPQIRNEQHPAATIPFSRKGMMHKSPPFARKAAAYRRQTMGEQNLED